MLDEKIARLKAIPLLSSLDDIALHHLAFNSETRFANVDEILFNEGDSASGALFVERGSIGLFVNKNGLLVETSKTFAGSILDPFAMLVKATRPVTAKTLGPVSYQILERAIFRRILENYPGHAERLEEYIKDHLTQTIAALNTAAIRLN